MAQINNDWLQVLEPEFHKPYYNKLYNFVKNEYNTHVVNPSADDVLNAYHATPLKDVKVVILETQPYIVSGVSDGLAYSTKLKNRLPRQLDNIFTELHLELGCYIPNNGDLHKWTEQGVFLLNCWLTVRENASGSHKCKGWEEFTNATMRAINEQQRPIVIMLWGKEAEKKKHLLTNKEHLVLTAPHPSPVSAYRGFFGCNHFIQANEFLSEHGLTPIDWQIENV